MKTTLNFQALCQSISLVLIMALFIVSVSAFGQSYCIPSGQSCNTAPYGNPFYIKSLKFLQANSASFTLTTLSCPSNGFKDETTNPYTIPFGPGALLNLQVQMEQNGFYSDFGNTAAVLWIDYNNDGNFNNTNEVVGIYAVGISQSPSFTFSIPANQFGKVVRARLRTQRDRSISTSEACAALPQPSDTRDFKLNLVPYCFQSTISRLPIGNSFPSFKSNFFSSVSLSSSQGTVTKSSGFDPFGYSDFRATTGTAVFSTPVTISGSIVRENPTATPNSSGNGLAIWADWNNNGTFSDAGELVGLQNLASTTTGNLAFTQTFMVPATVAASKVTIRVMTNYDGILNACSFAGPGPFFIGETEDYSLAVIASPGGSLAFGDQLLCPPADPGLISFSSLPTSSSVVYNWYYQDGLASQPTGPPSPPWTLIPTAHPITGATYPTYDPPAGLATTRTYACYITSRFVGVPPLGWAQGVRQVRVSSKYCLTPKRMAAEDENPVAGSNAVLEQNVPNPFQHQSTLSAFVPEGSQSASIQVFGMDGRKVHQIQLHATGKQDVALNRKDLPNTGIYMYSLVVDGQTKSVKRLMVTD